MCLAELSPLTVPVISPVGEILSRLTPLDKTCENCIALNIPCTLQQPCSLSMNHQAPARPAVLELICAQQIRFLALR